MFKKLNKKGFTLAELLIVVAIIGVLVAISIPIFTAQLEKSREAVDAANLRDAYAQITTAILTEEVDLSANNTSKITYNNGTAATGDAAYVPPTATVTATQQVAKWSKTPDIGGKVLEEADGGPGKWTISVNAESGVPTITYSTS